MKYYIRRYLLQDFVLLCTLFFFATLIYSFL